MKWPLTKPRRTLHYGFSSRYQRPARYAEVGDRALLLNIETWVREYKPIAETEKTRLTFINKIDDLTVTVGLTYDCETRMIITTETDLPMDFPAIRFNGPPNQAVRMVVNIVYAHTKGELIGACQGLPTH